MQIFEGKEMLSEVFEGKVWVFGDDINTDLIMPGYALYMPPEEQRRQCFAANRPGWVDEVAPGDVLVAGRNFGVGSARMIGDTFAGLGISGIVAESFNGLGLRNCINVGLAVIACPGVIAAFEEGDIAQVNWVNGQVRNVTKATTIEGNPIPPALQSIVRGGGVERMLKAEGYIASR